MLKIRTKPGKSWSLSYFEMGNVMQLGIKWKPAGKKGAFY